MKQTWLDECEKASIAVSNMNLISPRSVRTMTPALCQPPPIYAAGDYELPMAGGHLPRPNKNELRRTLSTRSVGPQVSKSSAYTGYQSDTFHPPRDWLTISKTLADWPRVQASNWCSMKIFFSISLIQFNIKHQQDHSDNRQHQEGFLTCMSNPVIFSHCLHNNLLC